MIMWNAFHRGVNLLLFFFLKEDGTGSISKKKTRDASFQENL